MTAGRRLVSFALVWMAALFVWVVAQWLWPYLELVAPVGALILLLFAVNVIDAIWFAVRNRRRFAAARRQRASSGGEARASQAPAVGLGGTR